MEDFIQHSIERVRNVIYNLLPSYANEQGKVIVVGVHLVVDQNIFLLYFSDRLTFSNIRGRTSRRIYRLALPLLSPETLSSLSKLRIFLFNALLALFVRRMT